ncbi:hypothetical protein [Dyella sp.]|jgi:hypothetical protein|uniref:hypothetical protein n=1 Tax=Dyella sp. TaxID=1869338 RepID=UPI002D77FBD5|nr:hypothetical protein [Dyella sp.]HET6433207.1 hypothetical protein [Dyella sp.]
MMSLRIFRWPSRWLILPALALTLIVYWPGLSGSFVFDDYPNIVDNTDLHVRHPDAASLTRAALSSPSSTLKRPLASLSFAFNYLATGLEPYGMKLTNLLIHLLNGWLVFLLARGLLQVSDGEPPVSVGVERPDNARELQKSTLSALLALGWMLLPINLTGVLYVVQRMESMANAFVLLGLIGYLAGRRRMFAHERGIRPYLLCISSISLPAAVGLLAKETAVMLPLYAFFLECVLFRFRNGRGAASAPESAAPAIGTSVQKASIDRRIVALFLVVLALPMVAGLARMLPALLKPQTWATRDFTMPQRLMSEARIVLDYIRWTVVPTPDALSFYHDDFQVSTGLLTPWTTLASIILLAGLVCVALWIWKRRPLVTLGIAWFLGCHLLTATIIPLELIYEHRNYFASLGLLIAIVPLLGAPVDGLASTKRDDRPGSARSVRNETSQALPLALPRFVLLGGLMLLWIAQTAVTAYAWGDPLRLARELADRAPASPRAQYELGRTYIVYSHYQPDSPFIHLAQAPLERAMALPESSILPEQALIFLNAMMHLPLKEAWWTSMVTKLERKPPGVQDESSLAALTKCAVRGTCDLPRGHMVAAYLAALGHPNPNARLMASYSDYAWNVLHDHELGLRMALAAEAKEPATAAYAITVARMQLAEKDYRNARSTILRLQSLNTAGSLDRDIARLREQLPAK